MVLISAVGFAAALESAPVVLRQSSAFGGFLKPITNQSHTTCAAAALLQGTARVLASASRFALGSAARHLNGNGT